MTTLLVLGVNLRELKALVSAISDQQLVLSMCKVHYCLSVAIACIIESISIVTVSTLIG